MYYFIYIPYRYLSHVTGKVCLDKLGMKHRYTIYIKTNTHFYLSYYDCYGDYKLKPFPIAYYVDCCRDFEITITCNMGYSFYCYWGTLFEVPVKALLWKILPVPVHLTARCIVDCRYKSFLVTVFVSTKAAMFVFKYWVCLIQDYPLVCVIHTTSISIL